MPSVSSGRMLIILKPFHMYIISCNETASAVGRPLAVKYGAHCEAPHQLPVAHVMELLPGLLGLAAILKECYRLAAHIV
ncbi:hypothetical protein EYF80_061948 [Liparis tanakae]|uniref:Uncharacterized protein n=1 Tax=Liparis tanakae TaxID=230148 RepID=A0A4Z2EHG2_9TELE|nr:hypothetical protein EYF80_061948 [Liparis tanakae]